VLRNLLNSSTRYIYTILKYLDSNLFCKNQTKYSFLFIPIKIVKYCMPMYQIMRRMNADVEFNHSFIALLITHSLTHSLITHSLARPPNHSLTRSLLILSWSSSVRPSVRLSTIHPSIHPFVRSLVRSFICSSVRLFIRSFIHSLFILRSYVACRF